MWKSDAIRTTGRLSLLEDFPKPKITTLCIQSGRSEDFYPMLYNYRGNLNFYKTKIDLLNQMTCLLIISNI
jgi:hypothetical protein